jgi:co-chaperonin GroES (HSP10)
MDLEAMRQTFKNQTETENIIWIGNTGFEASPEHLICKVDEFRSGYECPRCLDKDHRIKRGGLDGQTESVIPCENCHGAGKYLKGTIEIRCSHCEGSGKVTCPECGGKGSPTLVYAEQTKDAPTTGVVVSVGEAITLYKLGDRVCFTSYSGHGFDITGEEEGTGQPVQVAIRILVERDVLAKVHGRLEKKNIKRSMALSTGA